MAAVNDSMGLQLTKGVFQGMKKELKLKTYKPM